MTPLPSTLLEDLPFAFLDVETTGLYPRGGDRVCEIAVVNARLDQVEATFSSLVNPERPISPGAFAVNGITDKEVRRAPRFAQLADKVLARLHDRVVVCHNAPFDLGFMASEMQRLGRTFSAPTVIDTLQWARQCYAFPSNSLPYIAAALGIPRPAHRALDDALTTREVFNRFVQDLQFRGGRTLQHLQSAQGGPLSTAGLGNEVPLPPTLAEALSSGKRLFLVYEDVNGRRTERWVTPEEITHTGQGPALVAFCHLRFERRNFRLDRIVEMWIEE
jgi:DNA polymerase-3 subunit epsilon